MKKILPVLLCYVLATSQASALVGGPVFQTGNINPAGIYSGVLEGITEFDNLTGTAPTIPGDPSGAPTNQTGSPSNALGLFSLIVPASALASGTFVLFEDGTIFSGTIQASVDPDSDKLMGILEGSFSFALTTFNSTGNPVVSQVTATAQGKVNAKISSSSSFSSITLGRITGTANLDISFGEVDPSTLQFVINRSTTFNVIGFKQANG